MTTNCGDCSEVTTGETTTCKYTNPDTKTLEACPNDNCVQGATYITSAVFKTRGLQCGTVTYHVGVGVTYNSSASGDVNTAKAAVKGILGLIGGSIGLNLTGSATGDANGNITFCFTWQGDWS